MLKTFPEERQAFAFVESKGLSLLNPRLIMINKLAVKKYAWGLIRNVYGLEWDVEINDIFLKVEPPPVIKRKDTKQDKIFLEDYKQKQICLNLANPKIKLMKTPKSPFNKIIICRVNIYKEIFISDYIKEYYLEFFELLEDILLDYIKWWDAVLLIRLRHSEVDFLKRLPIKLQNDYSSAETFIEEVLDDLWERNSIYMEEV